MVARVGVLPVVIVVVSVALGFAPRAWVVEDCEPIPFSDDFNSYDDGDLINDLADWRATTGLGAPNIQGTQALIPIHSMGQTQAFIQPVCDGCVQQHGLFWLLDRVCRQFTQVEFDLLPTINTLDDSGKLSVYFASHETDTGALDSTGIVGPAVAIDLICTRTASNPVKVSVQPEIRAKESPADGGAVETVTVPTFTLPDFVGPAKRLFRFEFGWDWYVNPGQHDPDPPHMDQIGKPFLFVRIQYYDGTTWRNPMVEQSVPANPRVDPEVSEDRNFDGTGGWIKVGTDTRFGDSNLGHNNVQKTACDFRDWKAATNEPECPPVYPYVFAEQLGSAPVTWKLDNFAIRGVNPEPLTLFVNTVGYDTAAPQWALIRPNRTLFRDQVSMDEMDIATAELRAGNGDLLRSLAPGGGLTIGPARQCFQELDDMETFPCNFGLSPQIYWRRIDWTPITDAKNNCYLKLTGTTPAPDSKPFTIKSHTFNLAEEIWWTSIWSGVAIENELARRGSEWGFPGGWSDAGNNNAEGRADGLFISGLAHTLRERRGELSTAEMGDLIAAMKFGADWILKLVEENTDPVAFPRWTAHELLDQVCDGTDASHFFDHLDSSTEDQEGHIWEEHHSRPRAASGEGEENDHSNNIDRMFMCLYGLADVAWTLNAFDATAADTYRTQADKSRNYLYWLENPKCSLNPDGYMAYRLQAPLDVLFHDAGSGLPANTNQPDNNSPTDNIDLARRKLIRDLEQFPISSFGLTYREWASCNHDVVAPQSPPWLGLLQMRDRGQSGALWNDLLSTLADRWYVNDTHPDEAQNVLHVPRFWFNNIVNHQQYQGNVQRSCNKVLYETGSTAQLAMALGPAADSYDVLQLLTVGGIHWLMGIHYGVRGRYVLPYSDREWECGAFVPGFGSAHVVQNTIALHYWEKPSVLAGQGGLLSELVGDDIIGPDLPPWSYSPQSYGNTETFIQRDGPMLVACESATRLFHPLRIYEAEAGTLFNLGTAPNPAIVSNNDAAAGKLNGGLSYVGFDAGEGVRFTLWDPAQGTGAPDPNANERKYWILVRVGNVTGGTKLAKVRILQGTTTKFNGQVIVPQTFHQHEYVVLKFAASVTLYNNQAYTCEVTFPNGDVTFDRFELKSRGK